jgi:hypothetical protein
MHDISDSAVDYYLDYYGVGLLSFVEYLGTLGLRTYFGEDKPASNTLREEAGARGW